MTPSAEAVELLLRLHRNALAAATAVDMARDPDEACEYRMEKARAEIDFERELRAALAPAADAQRGEGGVDDVERVARAIYEACSGPWEFASGAGKDAARHEARAAIAALRHDSTADRAKGEGTEDGR